MSGGVFGLGQNPESRGERSIPFMENLPLAFSRRPKIINEAISILRTVYEAELPQQTKEMLSGVSVERAQQLNEIQKQLANASKSTDGPEDAIETARRAIERALPDGVNAEIGKTLEDPKDLANAAE